MEEKLGKTLECCSRVNCCACPKLKDVNCMSNLYAEVKRYIDDLEERLAIMQESMEALEKRNEPIPVKDVQWHEVTRKRMINGICPTCNSIITHFNGSRFCDKCGKAVKWDE